MVEEAGFGRAEMNSEKLAGTVKGFQRHIFLTWGLATEWPEDPFEKQYKGMLEIKGKVRITLVERSEGAQDGVVEGFVDGSSDLPGLRRQDGLVLLYPEAVEFDVGADGAQIPQLLAFLRQGGTGRSLGRDIEDTMLFVCAHAKRDARCGFCGPELTAKAEELLKLNEVPAMRIRKCSHVGGHKYAGNVLVYGRDTSHWCLVLLGVGVSKS
ncbi:Altered inheritance of mitochondria protein 32 [Durusdinium trenchii]|uniref:Altered inheritance of mitochondria protein 32 n=1 Tax=Durusdinium trenchii TaxID=1381693 RepID=A0ABP0S8E8_9DINO